MVNRIHPKFQLNGIASGTEELKEIAYSFVKEGEPFEKDLGDFLLDWLSVRPEVKVFTSGSTGRPKPYLLQKQHMLHSAMATGSYFDLKPGDKALLCLPARYIAGKMMAVRAMALGLSLDVVPPSSEPLAEVRVPYEFCAMVPQQFMGSLDRMYLVKKLIIGGAPLSSKGIAAAQDLQTQVFETFGMTETISHIAVRRINPLDKTFHTLPRVKAGQDERGCLLIHAPDITTGPVVTNDLIKLLSPTSFEWLGRYDTMINSGGIKLSPEQIESKMQDVLNCPFFLYGVPDETLGQRLVLVLETEHVPEKLDRQLRKLKSLSSFELPREIIGVPRFETTGSGKTDRVETLKKICLL
jgi:O-succinylbenzoic acid--CoA ligase